MEKIKKTYKNGEVLISTFSTNNGSDESYVLFEPEINQNFMEQVISIKEALSSFLNTNPNYKLLFGRMLISDASNQQEFINNTFTQIFDGACLSLVQQPSLAMQKILLIAYFASGFSKDEERNLFSHNGYKHLWTTEAGNHSDSYIQSVELLSSLEENHKRLGMTTEANCVRTWFYVRDIDTNYAGMVNGRNSVFSTLGLRADTHFIASTGIEGRTAGAASIVKLDSYSIKGLDDGQIKYLYAKSHLNPTYEYGVSFERGTTVSYGDRKHIFISGTASIDNHGNILYEGDIVKQTLRMWENCEALLAEAGATLNDFTYITVYLRDVADYLTVQNMFKEKFKDMPVAIVLAPVCRPGWLIEMEGIAVINHRDERFRPF